MRRSSVATLVCAALAFGAGAAHGAERHPHVGRLPGFPAIRGVVPVLGSSAAVESHEKLVRGAFAAVRSRRVKGLAGPAQRNEGFLAACENEALFLSSQDACYRGGPVVHGATVHLIVWQGPVEEDISTEPNVKLFPLGYVETLVRYIEDVAHESGAQTNVFAVDPQYFDRNAGGETTPGQYALSFDRTTGVTVDSTPFPKHVTGGCTDETEYSKGPCLLDSDIQKEVETVAKTSEKGLHDIYVVLTPPGVGGCFDSSSGECAFKQYCAYHGDFGGDGVTAGQQTLYAVIPEVGEVEGCDSRVHPNKAGGVDAAIDATSHELGEVITDPIGSQCKSIAKEECERNAWTDVIGQEVADKCLPPESTVAGAYGEALGELEIGNEASRFNQLINGDHYYTQRVWSNQAGVFEGGCVQRAIGASFRVSPGAAATVPITFDGSASGAPGDPAVYWVWSFGEGEQLGSTSPTVSHTFAASGVREVGLTAYDAYGNAQGVVELVNVAGAPIPSPPPLSPLLTPSPPAVKEAIALPLHLDAAQLAAALGLLSAGRELAGDTLLGHVACPPACAIVARLYAKIPVTKQGRRTIKLMAIGSARLTVAAKGVGALTVKLSAKGRALLHKRHRLSCQLRMSVEGQEGGTWQIVRSLTLVGSGSVARR